MRRRGPHRPTPSPTGERGSQSVAGVLAPLPFRGGAGGEGGRTQNVQALSVGAMTNEGTIGQPRFSRFICVAVLACCLLASSPVAASACRMIVPASAIQVPRQETRLYLLPFAQMYRTRTPCADSLPWGFSLRYSAAIRAISLAEISSRIGCGSLRDNASDSSATISFSSPLQRLPLPIGSTRRWVSQAPVVLPHQRQLFAHSVGRLAHRRHRSPAHRMC